LDWNVIVIDHLIDPELLVMEMEIISSRILFFMVEIAICTPDELARDAEEPDSRDKRNTR
jgi:hypothetical protein